MYTNIAHQDDSAPRYFRCHKVAHLAPVPTTSTSKENGSGCKEAKAPKRMWWWIGVDSACCVDVDILIANQTA